MDTRSPHNQRSTPRTNCLFSTMAPGGQARVQNLTGRTEFVRTNRSGAVATSGMSVVTPARRTPAPNCLLINEPCLPSLLTSAIAICRLCLRHSTVLFPRHHLTENSTAQPWVVQSERTKLGSSQASNTAIRMQRSRPARATSRPLRFKILPLLLPFAKHSGLLDTTRS
jgi:hypothetical protein